jgi:predicted kinase
MVPKWRIGEFKMADNLIPELVLVRGLPGSGKSTVAKQDYPCHVLVEADQYFINEFGKYCFNPAEIRDAHEWCQNRVKTLLEENQDVVVANTFTRRWEMVPYFEIAEQTGSTIEVFSIFDGGLNDEVLAERNVHAVPLTVIQNMRDRWELLV